MFVDQPLNKLENKEPGKSTIKRTATQRADHACCPATNSANCRVVPQATNTLCFCMQAQANQTRGSEPKIMWRALSFHTGSYLGSYSFIFMPTDRRVVSLGSRHYRAAMARSSTGQSSNAASAGLSSPSGVQRRRSSRRKSLKCEFSGVRLSRVVCHAVCYDSTAVAWRKNCITPRCAGSYCACYDRGTVYTR